MRDIFFFFFFFFFFIASAKIHNYTTKPCHSHKLTNLHLLCCQRISWRSSVFLNFPYESVFRRFINRGYYMAARRYEISLRVLKNIATCDLFTCEDPMFFSRVKISCFRAKAHLVFPLVFIIRTSYSLFASLKNTPAIITVDKWQNFGRW